MSANHSAVEKKMVELKSSDGELFKVEEKVAIESIIIKNLLDNGCGNSVIPVLNVTGKTLAKVIEYCKKHVEAAEKESNEEDSTVKAYNKELKAFDAEFVKVEHEEFLEIIMAADYLDIKGLLDMTIQVAVTRIRGMTAEQVRDFFHITNDYTPEEEQEVRNENAWAFIG